MKRVDYFEQLRSLRTNAISELESIEDDIILAEEDQLPVALYSDNDSGLLSVYVAKITHFGIIDNEGVDYDFSDIESYGLCQLADLVNEHKIKEWYANLDMQELEKISGLKMEDYTDPDKMIDDLENFTSAVDNWWLKLTDNEKQGLYEKYH